MKKTIVILLVAVFAVSMVFVGVGCKTTTAETTAAAVTTAAQKPASEITIAVVPKALDNAIFLDAKVASEAACKELGINFIWTASEKSDAAQQVTVIEGLIQKKVDGILISCNDADALKDVINKAIDGGIKVATFDSDSPDSKRLFYIGTDNEGFGVQAGDFMKQLLPDGGKVAILTGVLGAPNLELRIVGFKKSVAGTNIELLPVQTGEDDVQKSVEVVNQFTAANPDLKGWFFDGGWPYFASPEALKELKLWIDKGGKVVSIDTFQPMLQFVQLGMVDKLIGQNYVKMGNDGVRLLYDAIQGKKIESTNIDTGAEIVDKSNVEAVLKTKTPWE
jgi:ribose transport system substrate-binding protein